MFEAQFWLLMERIQSYRKTVAMIKVPLLSQELKKLEDHEVQVDNAPLQEEWAWWQENCPLLWITFKIAHTRENHRREDDLIKAFAWRLKFAKTVAALLGETYKI